MNDYEEEYVFEKDESVRRKRTRHESHRSANFASKSFLFSVTLDMMNGLDGAVEEMSEKGVMKAICSIEQKLLFEDSSPSIHSENKPVDNPSKKQVF